MSGSANASLPLLGKTALVTGSARGIGAAIAWKLASEGANIIIHYLSESSDAKAAELASRIRSLPNQPSVFTIRIDIATPTGPSDIIAALKAWLIATNLQGPLLMIQAAAPHLATPARIINVSSIAARQRFQGLTVYAASKAGLEAVTRHLAHELGGKGTTVNCVTPGAVESELLHETDKKIPGIIDSICASTPLQHRVGTAEEFAAVVAWLCRAESGWITGQTISATGGQAMY